MENTAGTYITIQSWMITDLNLKSNELIIYALIHGFCQDGMSLFYGSIKYIMSMTNLSKESVLSILQSLVKKGLIIKKDVKSYSHFDKTKNAIGNQHFCLYYTAASRNKSVSEPEFAGQESLPANNKSEDCGSRNLTGTGQESLPVAGQDFRPNNISNNKADTSTAAESKKKNTEEAEDFIKTELKKMFDGHYVFDDTFIQDLRNLIKQFELQENRIPVYLYYVLERVKQKKPVSLTNMFYKMAKSPNIMQDYILSVQEQSIQEKSITGICPVCGKKANLYQKCSNCNFDMSDKDDTKEVSIKKQLYNLAEDVQKRFREDLEKELEYQRKYSILEKVTNKALSQELQERLNKIYTKYGITA